ncbi:MAG: UDP-N-acetylglucosamine--LPS N-acetylglucosamine transferase [Pseudomonadota bacterium]
MAARKRRVLAIASSGGHWIQLSRLMPAWDGCDVTYATTDPGHHAKIRAAAAERGQLEPRYVTVVEANRWQKLRVVRSLFEMAFLILRVRPDVIITTGAAPGAIAVRLGGLMGRKTIWVDSIANAETLSMSGQKAGPHATLWLTQWEHLAKTDGPQYRGSVL